MKQPEFCPIVIDVNEPNYLDDACDTIMEYYNISNEFDKNSNDNNIDNNNNGNNNSNNNSNNNNKNNDTQYSTLQQQLSAFRLRQRSKYGEFKKKSDADANAMKKKTTVDNIDTNSFYYKMNWKKFQPPKKPEFHNTIYNNNKSVDAKISDIYACLCKFNITSPAKNKETDSILTSSTDNNNNNNNNNSSSSNIIEKEKDQNINSKSFNLNEEESKDSFNYCQGEHKAFSYL